MADLPLTTPIRIRPRGSDSIRVATTLRDASEILIDWPHARRGPFYQAAREQVDAALDGNAGTAAAQEAFVALCGHAGVLVR